MSRASSSRGRYRTSTAEPERWGTGRRYTRVQQALSPNAKRASDYSMLDASFPSPSPLIVGQNMRSTVLYCYHIIDATPRSKSKLAQHFSSGRDARQVVVDEGSIPGTVSTRPMQSQSRVRVSRGSGKQSNFTHARQFTKISGAPISWSNIVYEDP